MPQETVPNNDGYDPLDPRRHPDLAIVGIFDLGDAIGLKTDDDSGGEPIDLHLPIYARPLYSQEQLDALQKKWLEDEIQRFGARSAASCPNREPAGLGLTAVWAARLRRLVPVSELARSLAGFFS